jgi:hypothetical protein
MPAGESLQRQGKSGEQGIQYSIPCMFWVHTTPHFSHMVARRAADPDISNSSSLLVFLVTYQLLLPVSGGSYPSTQAKASSGRQTNRRKRTCTRKRNPRAYPTARIGPPLNFYLLCTVNGARRLPFLCCLSPNEGATNTNLKQPPTA